MMATNPRLAVRVCLAVWCISTAALAAAQNLASKWPEIDIVYPPVGTVFDRTCATFAKDPLATPALIDEAGKLRPRLAAEWAEQGPRYFAPVLKEIEAPFPYREMQAVLTVCGVGTMSMPLLIEVRQYLSNAKNPAPVGDFSEKLFHELMHHYVAGLTSDSPLRRKYAAESPVVLNHLHVMALEKFVLLELKNRTELDFLDSEYRTEAGAYARAWRIVNEIEGYEPFLAELKAAARARAPAGVKR